MCFSGMAIMLVGMSHRFFVYHRLRMSRRMRVMGVGVVTMRIMRWFGMCGHCNRWRAEVCGMRRILREIAFAPIDKTVKRDRIILAPDKQSERQKEQRYPGRKSFRRFNTARQINRRHNGDAGKRRHSYSQHQHLNTIGKSAQETEHDEHTQHSTQRRQSVLQGRRARIAQIELIGKRDGTFRIKDF